MAYTVDWGGTREIFVPVSDMIQLGPGYYQLDMTAFRNEVRRLEWEFSEGLAWPQILEHQQAVTLAGIPFAGQDRIINGYTVRLDPTADRVDLQGTNNNIVDVIVYNGVTVVPSNSAGLTNSNTLLQAAYANQICVDPLNGQSGTSTPIGTRGTPVNNLADALTIAQNNSIANIQFLAPTTISGVNFAAGYNFRADSTLIQITIDPSADVTNCTFENMSITGTLDGSNTFRRCNIEDINYVNGTLFQCALMGTITLGGNAQADILDCWSQVAGGGAGQFVAVDMGGSGNSLAVRNYAGGLNLLNYSGSGNVSIDMNSGRVIAEASVTAPADSIVVRGVADTEDSSLNGAILDLTVNVAVDDGFARVDELWRRQGLDAANPLNVTPDKIEVGPDGGPYLIEQDITGDGQTNSKVTRV